MLYSTDIDVVLPIINSIGAPVFLVDVLADGTFIYFAFNQHEEETVGLTNAQVRGKRPDELVSPEYAHHLIENYQRCVEAQSQVEVNTYLDTPAGRRWAINRLIPIFDQTGRFIRIMGTVIEITEQVLAEQRLKESENKYHALFDQSKEAIVITDVEGIIVEVNQAWLDLLGYTRNEFVGQSIATAYVDIAHFQVHRKRMFTDGYLKDEEISLKHQGGGTIIGLLTVTALVKDEGQPYLFFGIIHDITEQKTIENMLYFVAQGRHGESFFVDLIHYLAHTLNVSHAFLGELRPDGQSVQTIAVCDKGQIGETLVYTLSDSPSQNVVGKELCYYPQDIRKLFPLDSELSKTDAESYMGIPLGKSDGQPLGIIVLMDDQPLKNPQLAETLLQIVAVRAAHELERQHDEESLKASEAHYRAVIQDQTEFVCRIAPDLTLTFVNDAYCRFFGQPPEALLGNSIWSQIPEEDKAIVQTQFARLSPEQPSLGVENRNFRPNGEIRWLHWTDRALYDDNQMLIGYQAVGRDITERKKAEADLAYYSDFQSLITIFATEFINIPPQKIDEAINHALQAIGEFVGASRCIVNMLSEDMTSSKRTHVWYATGFGTYTTEMQNIPLLESGAKWALENLVSSGSVEIPNVADLVDEAADLKGFLSSQQTQALVGVTLTLRKKFIGFITIHFPKPQVSHTKDTIKLLHVVAETFVNALDRKQSDEEIRILTATEEIQRQHRVFTEALLDTGMVLSSTLNFEELMDRVFDNMQSVVRYDTAVILLNNNSEFLDALARYGYPPDRTYASRLQLTDLKYLPLVIENQQPIIISDTRSDPYFINQPIHHEFNIAYLFVPMILDGSTIGILVLASRTPDFFQSRDAQYLQIFAQQTGLAVRNSQLYKEAQTLAALKERQRLARDLHDSVSQTLFSAATFAELVARLLDNHPDKARQYILEVEQLTRTAVAEMRTLLMELRPDALTHTELGVLLKQLCDALSGNIPIQATLTVTDKVILPEESQVVFYRVAQEALNNIAKHAHATQVSVKLHKTDQQVELRISDNGRGFAQNEISSDHFGLKIMLERASSIGADLIVNSTDGTEIILSQKIA